MKKKAKVIKARVNPQGLMGSAFRVHKSKKGKGSYSRKRLSRASSGLIGLL